MTTKVNWTWPQRTMTNSPEPDVVIATGNQSVIKMFTYEGIQQKMCNNWKGIEAPG